MENTDQFILSFQEFISRQQLFTKKDRLLLAVSGGMDSVVLAACCHQSGFDFGIAHANFQLRGEESERDEAFVRTLADKYGKPCLVKKFPAAEYAGRNGISIQVAARELRYRWFESLLGKDAGSYRFILTAHHLDDNVETMLMHFFRGTGIAGLRGMLPRQGYIIRPLLPFRKTVLLAFSEKHRLSWVEDSSNHSDKYTRNYFRSRIIPALEEIFPETRHNLEGNLQRFAEAEVLYRQAVAAQKKKLLKPAGNEMHMPILLLKKSDPLRTILFEILHEYGFSAGQLEDCIRLMDGENGKFVSSHTHRLIRNRSWLILAPLQDEQAAHLIIEEGQTQILFPQGELKLKNLSAESHSPIEKQAALALLDADKIRFPLILRKWKPGDYFYPLGMKKKKKIARFLIDQKLSKTEKEKVWVLESDRSIVWVAGYRIDNRFAVAGSTRTVLKIEMRIPQLG